MTEVHDINYFGVARVVLLWKFMLLHEEGKTRVVITLIEEAAT